MHCCLVHRLDVQRSCLREASADFLTSLPQSFRCTCLNCPFQVLVVYSYPSPRNDVAPIKFSRNIWRPPLSRVRQIDKSLFWLAHLPAYNSVKAPSSTGCNMTFVKNLCTADECLSKSVCKFPGLKLCIMWLARSALAFSCLLLCRTHQTQNAILPPSSRPFDRQHYIPSLTLTITLLSS